jgi:hypothetical protein
MRPTLAAATFLAMAFPLSAQFDYDRKQAFDTTCESLHARPDAEIRGCGFTGPAAAASTSYTFPRTVRSLLTQERFFNMAAASP